MVIIGIDPHPESHTAAALDKQGKVLSHCTVENTKEGLATFGKWLDGYEVERCAVEGANNPFTRALSQGLLGQDYWVVDVAPSLTSQYRSKRGRKKSDQVDAENVARAALANPELSAFAPQQAVEDLKSLTRTREALVKQLTAHRLSLRSLELAAARQALEAVVTVLAKQLKCLEQAMKLLVDELMPELLDVQGVGVVHAATLLAEAGDVRRFRSQHAFAMYAWLCPGRAFIGWAAATGNLTSVATVSLNRTFHMIDASYGCVVTKQTQSLPHQKTTARQNASCRP